MELDLIEALSLVTNCTKNKTLSHVLSNNGLCQHMAAQYVLLFLVLAVNSLFFFFLELHALLVLMSSCHENDKRVWAIWPHSQTKVNLAWE